MPTTDYTEYTEKGGACLRVVRRPGLEFSHKPFVLHAGVMVEAIYGSFLFLCNRCIAWFCLIKIGPQNMT